jgi:hypothetical protein
MKQTAVDWLFTKLWETPKDKFVWNSILNEAKEMEEEQIRMAFIEGKYDNKKYVNSETYYQETYESE